MIFAEEDMAGSGSGEGVDPEDLLFPHAGTPGRDPFGVVPSVHFSEADVLANLRAATIVGGLAVEPLSILMVGEPNSGKSAIAHHIGEKAVSAGLFKLHEIDCRVQGTSDERLFHAAGELRKVGEEEDGNSLVIVDHLDSVVGRGQNHRLNDAREAFHHTVRLLAQQGRAGGNLTFLFIASGKPGSELPRPRPNIQKFVSRSVGDHKTYLIPQAAEDGLIEIHNIAPSPPPSRSDTLEELRLGMLRLDYQQIVNREPEEPLEPEE